MPVFLSKVHNAIKANLYVGLALFAVLLCLSNSVNAVVKTVWSGVGNNWAVAWSFLEDRFSSAQLFIYGTIVLHFMTYWPLSLLFFYFDSKGEANPLARFKIQPGTNTPVDTEKLKKCAIQVLKNQILVGGPFTILAYYAMVWRGMKFTLPLPSFERFLFDMVVILLIEEVLFYYSHRLFHHPKIYGLVHKQHHEWIAPVGMAAIYAHPLEHLISNTIPVFAGPFIVGTHLGVMWVWFTMAIINTISTHSGYHLPFLSSPEAHDFHHLRFNQCYGVLGILDYLHGTDTQFRASAQFVRHQTYFNTEDYPAAVAAASAATAGKDEAGSKPKSVKAQKSV